MNATDLKDHPRFGSFAAIAAVVGLSREAVRKWDLIPADHCPAVEGATAGDVTCEQLRPDVEWVRDANGVVTGYTTRISPVSPAPDKAA